MNISGKFSSLAAAAVFAFCWICSSGSSQCAGAGPSANYKRNSLRDTLEGRPKPVLTLESSNEKDSAAPIGKQVPAARPAPAFPSGRQADSPASAARRLAAGQPDLDKRIFRFFNRTVQTGFLDTLMPAVTDFDRLRVVVLLIWSALVIFGKTRGRWAALALIPLIVASDQISSSLLKQAVERLRPVEVLGGVHFWSEDSGWMTTPLEVTRSYKSSFSFPSGHATNITAAMLFLGLVYRKLLVPLFIVAILVSISRIYIGAHWPLDVAAGMALGAALGSGAYLVFRKYAPTDEASKGS